MYDENNALNKNPSRSMRSAWIEIGPPDKKKKHAEVALHAERVD